ncbi:cytochrome c biogenesis protein DipZ [Oceanispirochaeta sp.]|jgi:cytochrome c biogenesis protein CcdA/thiol-disulfide isomerase/thioredoxin|uniref:cytochrome c biogenesis protein DipZ n=1 Tax=Oceanispirochaeta sp. TaxID=2035350 RepID=UPI00262813C7|nr:cytochrome c biogenesis protein DipZ [Oceanispirochaeta sp.]MDA3956281.1 cytochrome c biogenesis protein DipZ [Oceanispirochaeta sp.]
MAILLFFAFLSGIVTILSPCILPVLPIVLSGSVGGKRRPLGVVLGFITSFSAFTLLLSSLVQFLNIPPDSLRIAAVVLLVLFGTVMIVPWLRTQFEVFASKMTSRSGIKRSSSGFFGGFMVGISLGLVWTPCVGPIMASVISLAITQSVDGASVLIILAYSLGTSIPMFIIMMGGRKVINRFPRLSRNPKRIQKIFGVLMILVGVSIAFGIDRQFQSALLDLFPDYGSGLTAFEDRDSVRSILKDRNNEVLPVQTDSGLMSRTDEPKNARLGDYGLVPEIVTPGPWLNTEGNQALTMESLKGKVILIDFWTYSCINCVRTLPHLRAWHDAYADEGLVIIGVHSPEFAFEKKLENVEKAMKDLGVTWPVVLDNDFLQWKAYQNRYWPAHYFIDAQGNLRYFHFGEGQYEESEKVIRKLLDEAGRKTTIKMTDTPEKIVKSQTHEIYLGFGRTEGFKSKTERLNNNVVRYAPEEQLKNGEWSLQGPWTFKREFIESVDKGILNLEFHAKNVYLVLEKTEEDSWIEVLLDGDPGNDTIDVQGGKLIIDESRLYEILSLPETGQHRLILKVHGKAKLFAFTFG